MSVHRCPEPDQLAPVLLLVVLDGDPPVVVSQVGIIGVGHRALLVVHMDYPMCIVSGGVHHMSNDLSDIPVLTVYSVGNGSLR